MEFTRHGSGALILMRQTTSHHTPAQHALNNRDIPPDSASGQVKREGGPSARGVLMAGSWQRLARTEVSLPKLV